MKSGKQTWIIAVLFIFAMTAAFAKTKDTNPTGPTAVEVAEHLEQFQRQASDINHEIEGLLSITGNPQVPWASHSYRLSTIRDGINSMGKTLEELESMYPRGTAWQMAAIEGARPHLAAMVEDTEEALNLLREGSHVVLFPEYKEHVEGMYQHGTNVSQTLDTIADYEDARIRLYELQSPAVTN